MIVCTESVSGMYVPESFCRRVLLVSLLLKTETEYITVRVLWFSVQKVVCLIVPLLIKYSLLNCTIMQRTSLLVVGTAGSNTICTLIQGA